MNSFWLKASIFPGWFMVFWSLGFNLFAQTGSPGDFPLTFGPNQRIYPGTLNQTEVFITRHPSDPDILWASCNTLNFVPFFISEGIYVSIDGGKSWRGSDSCNGAPIAYHGGDPGITVDHNGTFILTRLGRSPFVGLYSHFSSDNGMTFSSQKVISTDDLERAALATNTIPGTPGYGRTYAGWIKFAHPFPMMFAHTDDGAGSWSIPGQLNQPPRRSAGGDIAIGPNGEVYVCWAGVTDVSPFREVQVGFASSLNGGTDWTIHESAYAMNGINGMLAEKGGIRVNGLPAIAVDVTEGSRKGWIYIVTGEKGLPPAGSDPDIILHRSADGGATWSPGIRINQDPPDNGKIQYFPTIHVDIKGNLYVIYYDDRNTTSDSAAVFLARSTDGGDTWKEYEISDRRFKPIPIGGLGQGYQGDNIDITSTPTHLWPVWMDNRTGTYQIWSVPILISQLENVHENPETILQPGCRIFPNPSSGLFTVEFTLSSAGMVQLTLVNPLGQTLVTIRDEYMQPGTYRETVHTTPSLTGNTLLPGIYFCRFQSGTYTSFSKMMVRQK